MDKDANFGTMMLVNSGIGSFDLVQDREHNGTRGVVIFDMV